MSLELALAVASMVLTVGGVVGSYFANDARSRTRIGFLEERLQAHRQENVTAAASDVCRLSALEVQMARSMQDREEIHRALGRLDESKASREIVDGIRAELGTFRQDMDRRFDRLERLIIAGSSGITKT